MIEATDPLMKALDLSRDGIRRAIHDHALLFLKLQRLRAYCSSASPERALQRLHVHCDRHITGRVAELRRDLDVDVPRQFTSTGLRLLFGIRGIDERHERRPAAARE